MIKMLELIIQLAPYLFIIILGIGIIFLIFGNGSTYNNLTSSRGFICSLFKISHIPVKICNRLTNFQRYVKWEIETSPPEWLPIRVIQFKNKITWKDRAYFWHLLLRSGSYEVYKNIGNQFLPQLVAQAFKIIIKKMLKIFLNFSYYANRFHSHPIKAYLEFAGSISGEVINWICRMPYKDKFIESCKKAGFPIGFYYGKKYLENPVFSRNINDATTAMQFIMVIYVLFGLAGWERHLYPRNQPKVEIISANHAVISFPGIPYKCPHKGMKCPAICQGFVTWEDGLVKAINPKLKAYVSKALASGDNCCEVVVKEMN